MKIQLNYYLQFSLLSSLYGNAGSPLLIYENLLASGHIEKAVQAPVDGFSVPSGMAFHHDVGDAKMHESAEHLRIMFNQLATKFYKAVIFDGSNLLNEYKTIVSVTVLSELDLNRMSRALHGAKHAFRGVEDNRSALQREVHSLIEGVRERIRELKSEIKDKENKRQIMEEEIDNMEEEIRENEMMSANYDRRSQEMKHDAYVMRKEAEEAGYWGGLEILGAAGALAVGYATGGLAFVAVPSVILGGLSVKNVNDASEYRSRSDNYAREARMYDRKARELRSDIRQTRLSVNQLKLDTQHIKHLLFQYESSLAKVSVFSESLHKSVGATYHVILMLQNMEVAVKNAEIDTESLQQRFKQLSHVFTKAESTLKTTQSAWGTIQELLKMHHKLLT